MKSPIGGPIKVSIQVPIEHGAAQITAAVRCKRSKWVFLLGTLCGYEWKERDLFHPPDQVRHYAGFRNSLSLDT